MNIFIKLNNYRRALLEAPFFCRLFLAGLAGLGLSFIQAPYGLWFLIFPCFGLFYFLYVPTENKKQAFLTGFVFAFGYFLLSLNWIGNALLVEGNEYKWVWPLAVIALPALLSSFTALYVTITHILFKRKNTLNGFIAFCALLSLSEWVRGYAFTGFPWNLYGYGWANILPVMQSLSLFGPYGLTFFTILWGCAFGFVATKSSGKMTATILVLLSFGFIYGFGALRLNNATSDVVDGVSIHIVQPNIQQEDKWRADKLAENFEKHIALSVFEDRAQKNIIIWPETSLPPSFLDSTAVHERIHSILGGNSILLAGALKINPNPHSYHNALMLWDGQKRGQHLYSKSHLVPFGEYIPFQQYIPIETISGFSGFNRGSGAQTIEIKGYPSFSPLICYEVIFPHQAVNKAQNRPDYILTITNDGWYGNSAGPYQHFEQARFRAIEQGIPVIRAANTGISSLIDPYGRVIKQANLMSRATITGDLPVKIKGETYYSMFGDRLFLALVLLCLLRAFLLKQKSFS